MKPVTLSVAICLLALSAVAEGKPPPDQTVADVAAAFEGCISAVDVVDRLTETLPATCAVLALMGCDAVGRATCLPAVAEVAEQWTLEKAHELEDPMLLSHSRQVGRICRGIWDTEAARAECRFIGFMHLAEKLATGSRFAP